MHVKTLIASLFLAVSALAAPTDLETRQSQSCSKLQLVFLAGTNEEGLGLAGGPLSTSLQSAVSGTTNYSVPYDTRVEYGSTITAGATLVVNYLTAQAARCPNQVFALGGYSKGAMVILLMERMEVLLLLLLLSRPRSLELNLWLVVGFYRGIL
ncbi:hypothetical protein RSAG8_03308, partial [Rhizoctonia solani AG-8 WAC10335]